MTPHPWMRSNSVHSIKWLNAMNDELKSIKDNDIWDLVELPKGRKLIGCKWVFKTKRDSKGNIERYKARLVAKVFTQREGIDYKETFSPVFIKDSFRIIMVLVAHFDLGYTKWMLRQPFLMVTLRKKFIWCNQIILMPKVYNISLQKKSIYSPKQASHQ